MHAYNGCHFTGLAHINNTRTDISGQQYSLRASYYDTMTAVKLMGIHRTTMGVGIAVNDSTYN
jgi:hypothetical protein